ncbi:MAG TPA: hypothetical protein PLO05_00945 [Bacteroidales bacterium]|jgi:hypothetical protein|nr:hypothetical protein [Bacteroidales bacterium]MDY0160794.1 hypothetical protein [Bacteroidales bacterium]HXK80708.1 hypothetical protein [Bacteroidales bacterium]
MKKTIVVVLILICNISYTQEIRKYIFIGHPYNFKSYEGLFDLRCVDLELPKNYERIWLGGDVLAKSLKLKEHVEAVDVVFDISNPSNHWVMGNHDAWGFNWEWYYEICNRKTYHAHYEYDITTIVVNTNITPIDCEKLDDQYRMIKNVCDTISESLALIVMFHHGVWVNVPGLLSPSYYSNISKPYWNSNCFNLEQRWFSNSIYPMLKQVKERGVDVYCLMGDMGSFCKSFSGISDDGIHFLGCGLWNSAYYNQQDIDAAGKDMVLIFEHNVEERSLEFGFHDIDSLVNAYRSKSTFE